MPETFVEVFDDLKCSIMEMGQNVGQLVHIDPSLISEITEGDTAPQFVTVAIESGWSSNKRYYSPDTLKGVVEQINSSDDPVVAYLGHIKPEDDASTFPEPQTRWLKSTLSVTSEKVTAFVKGYNLPGAKIRELLKRKAANSVSIRGKALLRPIKGGVEVREFKLESIDWSRPGKAGMAAKVVAVTAEMENQGGNSVEPKDIAALTEDELRQHNPLLVKEIEGKAKKDLETKVTEMETAQEPLEASSKLLTEIRTAFGIDENADLLEIVKTAISKVKDLGKVTKEKLLTEAIGKKFKDENTQILVKRVILAEQDFSNLEDDEKVISEMVDKFIEKDEALRKMVEEMDEQGGANLPDGKKDNRKERELKPGYENTNIRVVKGGRA